MGILEPITHKEEIQELLDDAKKIYDRAIDLSHRKKVHQDHWRSLER